MMIPVFDWLVDAEAFCRRCGRPMVTLSYAQSLDGSIAARAGQATLLSGPQAARLTHRLRAAHAAILVGIGTVLADNPRLNVRLAQGGPDPQPVVLDAALRTPLEANLVRSPARPLWLLAGAGADPARRAALEAVGVAIHPVPESAPGQLDLPAALALLARLGVTSLMVEGGAGVITSFLQAGLVDQAAITIAPLFLGGAHGVSQRLAEGAHLVDAGWEQLGQDGIVWGKVQRG